MHNSSQSTDNLFQQVENLRKLFREAESNDIKLINEYAWLIVKLLNAQATKLGSAYCRQLLADYLQLPVQHPSRLHSAILSSAVNVFNCYPDFRFANFLKMWDIKNLRQEDMVSQQSQDGKSYPSLARKTAKALGVFLIIHSKTIKEYCTGERSDISDLEVFLHTQGYQVRPMIVTRIKNVEAKDGRKYHFVTLTSTDGFECETVSQNLIPSPINPLPNGKRHYVNIGQLYNVLFHNDATPLQTENNSQKIIKGCLSKSRPQDTFNTTVGYVESIDKEHSHIHIYDAYSRHFVAHLQRFSHEKCGDFIRFIPIIPLTSKFKTAIIVSAVTANSEDVLSMSREICINNVYEDKGYASWELTSPETPIKERLSTLQISQGEQSPSFTTGYLNIGSLQLEHSTARISVGQHLKAFIYLRRGKDRQKRPHVAAIL